MALEAFYLPVLFLRILSYTEQSLNLKIKESPGTLMKKRKVCVLLILIVVFVLAVGWKRTDPEVRRTSGKAIAENIAGQGMLGLVEQSVEHPKAALTFDDGPTGNEGGRTERLLDGLKQRNAHATFFLCGYRVKDFNSMMKRYLAEGHEVGNHTMDHRLAHEVSDGDYEQVSSNNDLIQSYTGQKPTLFRPCGGEYNDSVQASMKQLGMPLILWDVDTLDWKYRDAASVKQHILDGAQDGAIVLEHDLYETTVEGVLAAIDELQQQGYAFVTVSELAKIKGVTLEPGQVYTGFTDEDLGLTAETDAAANTANTQASDSTSN